MTRTNVRDLSPARQEITLKMQELVFGKICDLPVRDGEPILQKARISRRYKLSRGSQNRVFSNDFQLKVEHRMFFELLDVIQNGVIECMEIRDGLPCLLDTVEEHA